MVIQRLIKIFRNIVKGDWEFKKLVFISFFYCFYVRFLMLFVKYKRYEDRLGERGVASFDVVEETQRLLLLKVRAAVVGVSNHTPWESKCMVQALATKWILKRYGIASTIYFGVMKDPENTGALKAHAWLRVGEYIVTGKEGHMAFKVVNFYT